MTKVVVNKTPTSLTRFSDQAIEWLEQNGYTEAAETLQENNSIPRDHKGLVAVVEELGPNAGKWSCRPTIIEIPDEVEWSIGSQAQREVIIEDHREWHP